MKPKGLGFHNLPFVKILIKTAWLFCLYAACNTVLMTKVDYLTCNNQAGSGGRMVFTQKPMHSHLSELTQRLLELPLHLMENTAKQSQWIHSGGVYSAFNYRSQTQNYEKISKLLYCNVPKWLNSGGILHSCNSFVSLLKILAQLWSNSDAHSPNLLRKSLQLWFC